MLLSPCKNYFLLGCVRVQDPNTSLLNKATVSNETDDHLSRKPKGVSKSNGSKAMEKLLSCKQYTNVATMNVRTVKNKSKQQELSYNCEKQSINILGVIDHKITHQEEIRYESVDRHTHLKCHFRRIFVVKKRFFRAWLWNKAFFIVATLLPAFPTNPM